MVELRAPRRRRPKASHERDYLPLIFVVILVFVLGSFAWAKQQERNAQLREVARIEAANALTRAENERVLAEAAAAAERRRKNWERSQAAYPESYRNSYQYQPSYRAPEKTVMQRQAEALAIMEQSRNIQQRSDRQEYSRDGSAQVIAESGHKRALCQQIESERNRIHERMRQLYTAQEGEYFRGKLRSNHDQRIRFGC